MNVKINSEAPESQHQTVSFSDQNQQWIYSVGTALDSAHRAVDTEDASLSNFFSRPIKIASINWTVGSTLATTINPWQLYFENLRVINRITNYNVLRSKLNVRLMINGNGFHYGRALASYRPLHNDDDMIGWRIGLVPQDFIAASQRMHVWLDPTKSQGGTLCLPYVYYKNGMNIPEQDWRDMGELDIGSFTTLEHANGGTDSVVISVFAWAEDVSLSIPTVAEPGALAPQSDEYGAAQAGPISGPASALARVAGVLSSVPSISTMATATQMAASGVANIARLFGMSRPVDAGPISAYKPTYVGNMANTNVLDTSTKLTYDVKQELTIDPVATGLGPADEMAISSIAARESFLTSFLWPSTGANSTPESLLWNCYVTPTLFDTAAPSGFTEFHYTPVAWVSKPFENWRGTLKYRFQIVASAFHKGRLKIVYDPYLNTSSEYNVQYTHIIDLAKERDFTVEIGWGQEFSYLDHSDDGALGVPFSTSVLPSARHGEVNGTISVYVVNDLTTPSSTLDPVSVLVSVSAGDNFEVVNPSDNIPNVTFFQPQSVVTEPAYFLPQKRLQPQSSNDIPNFFQPKKKLTPHSDLSTADQDMTTEETRPVDTPVEHQHGEDVNTKDDAIMIYFGDPVTSIRQVLKRYNQYRVWATLGVQGANGLRQTLVVPNFPFFRGYDPNGIDNASTPVDPTPFTYTTTNHLQWFTVPFLCRRGGIRHKYQYTTDVERHALLCASRVAENGAIGYLSGTTGTVNTASASSQVADAQVNTVTGLFAGGHATSVDQNPVLEIELPFMTNRRFAPARKKVVIAAADPDSQAHVVRYPLGDSPGFTQLINYVAAGEDYSLSFFQACPVFWQENSPSPSLIS